jgi:hypothetical protein
MDPIAPQVRVKGPHPSSGYSLLETLLGMIILGMVLQGAYLMSRNSIQSNIIGRDLSKGASVLKDFVEEIRGLPPDSLPRNREVIDSVGKYRLAWRVYDQASTGVYRQPVGLLQVCAKLTFGDRGRTHKLETTTLLGKQ